MIGGGYVGLVSGACFADLGVDVAVVEVDPAKLAALQEGRIPIYEPGLDRLVAENVAAAGVVLDADVMAAIDAALGDVVQSDPGLTHANAPQGRGAWQTGLGPAKGLR